MTNPRYRAIAERLRDKITSELPVNGALPTEAELCAEYGVSRSTVRKALGLLRDEGWLEARQGSGWSVPLARRERQFGTFRLRVTRDANEAARSRTLGSARRRPPDAVARSLDTNRRGRLLVVERVTESGDITIHRSETWFSRTLSDTIDAESAEAVPPARLLADLGHEFGPFDQYAEAVLSDERDGELLDVPDGSAVLQIIRTAYATDRKPLFKSLHRHPGPTVRLDIDFPTTDQSEGLFVGFQPST